MGNDIDSLSGIEFENICKKLIENMGFSVETTKASGDGGIDLIAYNHEPILSGKYIIQCKRYSGGVGEPIIRDLYGVITSERANKGILITTGYFTKSAIAFADGKPIELMDGKLLDDLLKRYGVSIGAFSIVSNEDIIRIEQEIDNCNLEFRKSYNRFDSEMNALLFSVDDEELYDDISAKYVTLRIYEVAQAVNCSLQGTSKEIVIFKKLLKDIHIVSDDSEYQMIYHKFLDNTDNYRTIMQNTAMSNEDELMGGFWLDLMVAAGDYNENETLKNIIDYHKEYLDELAKIILYFVRQDSFTEKYCILDGWLEDYKNELYLIKEAIDKS
jgi:hypothetical protein